MDSAWIASYCLSKNGAVKDYQMEWEAIRYLLQGKMFGMQGEDKDGRAILTLKLAPAQGELLHQEHEGKIIPGYYMNKTHWNSLYLDQDISEDLVKSMIDESYQLIFSSLSKAKQNEIENR